MFKYKVEETIDFFNVFLGYIYTSFGVILLFNRIWWAGIPAIGVGL